MEIKEGMRFTRLVVMNKIPGSRNRYRCRCDCGKELEEYGSHLLSGNKKSCGCLNDETRKKMCRIRSKTHGMTHTTLYSKYCGMKERCYNKNYKYYHRYGGRGIKVCKEWLDSFQNFADWAYKSGYDDNKSGYEQTLDRIDNNGNYCPDNCRWADQKTQTKNRSISSHIIFNGEDLNYTEFANKYNIASEAFVRRRHSKGQSPEQIISDWNEAHSNKYYSLKEASNIYSVCEGTIYNWIYSGKIKATKIGMTWYIPKGQCINKK